MDIEASKKKRFVTFTAVNKPLMFDITEERTNTSILYDVLRKRLEETGRTALNKARDEDFLRGVCCFYDLRYADDILQLVLRSDSVELAIKEQ